MVHGTAINIRRFSIPSLAPERTVLRMIRDQVRTDSKDEYIRIYTIRLLQQAKIPGKAHLAEIQTIYEFVKNYIRFVKDPKEYERIQSARKTLFFYRSGDCDDMTVLLGAMLMSIGYDVKVTGVALNPIKPWKINHVFITVLHGNKKIPLDPSDRSLRLGFIPYKIYKKVEY